MSESTTNDGVTSAEITKERLGEISYLYVKHYYRKSGLPMSINWVDGRASRFKEREKALKFYEALARDLFEDAFPPQQKDHVMEKAEKEQWAVSVMIHDLLERGFRIDGATRREVGITAKEIGVQFSELMAFFEIVYTWAVSSYFKNKERDEVASEGRALDLLERTLKALASRYPMAEKPPKET